MTDKENMAWQGEYSGQYKTVHVIIYHICTVYNLLCK